MLSRSKMIKLSLASGFTLGQGKIGSDLANGVKLVSVMDLTGSEIFGGEVETSITVTVLKRLIEANSRIPILQQNLLFRGVVLDGNQQLANCDPDESNIKLLLIIREVGTGFPGNDFWGDLHKAHTQGTEKKIKYLEKKLLNKYKDSSPLWDALFQADVVRPALGLIAKYVDEESTARTENFIAVQQDFWEENHRLAKENDALVKANDAKKGVIEEQGKLIDWLQKANDAKKAKILELETPRSLPSSLDSPCQADQIQKNSGKKFKLNLIALAGQMMRRRQGSWS